MGKQDEFVSGHYTFKLLSFHKKSTENLSNYVLPIAGQVLLGALVANQAAQPNNLFETSQPPGKKKQRTDCYIVFSFRDKHERESAGTRLE